MLKKSIAVAALAGVLALGIAGCGSTPATSASQSGGSSASAAAAASSAPAETSQAKDFDGSKFSDAGEGTMILRTAGGTSEGGNIPEIVARPGSIMQLGLDTEGMDGSVCVVYVDGIENMKVNASERSQGTLTIQGSAVEAGLHTVELVKMDGDKAVIYKKAQYKMV